MGDLTELRDEATLRPKVTLEFSHYPRCLACWENDGRITPNPEGRSFCPVCNSPMAIGAPLHADNVVLNQPVLARVCYWFADALVRFSDWLSKG